MPTPRDVLVWVFLRGGADGLALVPPLEDPTFRSLRPSLSMVRSLHLGGGFGLHPALAPLLPAYRAGELAFVHAVGSDDATRSHFEAQERMERASTRPERETDGWLARHLRTRRGPAPTTLTAVAIGTAAPDALTGAPAVAVLESIEALAPATFRDAAFGEALDALHAAREDPLHAAGRDALRMLARLRSVARRPVGRAADAYPHDAFGRGLREVARLLRADAGLEVACLELDGWDTHIAEHRALEAPARSLAAGLAAFRAELGDAMERVTVAVATEFGRRVRENAALGTDHGRASVMLLLGGGVRGGRVVTDWPGLAPDALEEPGDLRVTIDHRHVLAELVRVRLANPRLDAVLPGFAPRERGLFAAA